MSQLTHSSLLTFALLNAIALSAQGQTAPPPPAGLQPPAGVQPPMTAGQPPQYPPANGVPVPTAGASAPATMPAPIQPQATPNQQFLVPPGYMLVPMAPAADPEAQRQLALEREREMMEAYQEGDPVPAGYRVVQESRRGLVIAGSIVGGIAYGFSVVGAVGADFEDKSATLMAPVLGPWLMLAMGGAKDRSCDYNDTVVFSSSYCGDRSGLRAALTLDGLTQAAGAIMLTVGLAYPRARLVRQNFQVSLSPMPLARDGYGLGAVGSF